MTKFSRFWNFLKVFDNFLVVFFIWQNFEPTLTKKYKTHFHCSKRPSSNPFCIEGYNTHYQIDFKCRRIRACVPFFEILTHKTAKMFPILKSDACQFWMSELGSSNAKACSKDKFKRKFIHSRQVFHSFMPSTWDYIQLPKLPI